MAVHPVELMENHAQLTTRLAACTSPLDALAVLAEEGQQFGYDVWLVVAPNPQWHGYLFSTKPLAGRAVQWHTRSLIEEATNDNPALAPPPRRTGALPVQAACAQWEETQPAIKRWHDFAVPTGGRRVCTARVGAFDGQLPYGWEPAEQLLTIAGPHLAFLLSPPADTVAPMIDPTTGLYSSAYFHDQLEREVQRAAAYAAELTLLMIDLVPKGAAEMVDTATLRAVSTILSTQTRGTDICARLGPGRLAVLMPHTGARAGLIAATRIEETIRRETDVHKHYNVAIGISGWNLQGPDENELLRQAEAAAKAAAEAETDTPCVYV